MQRAEEPATQMKKQSWIKPTVGNMVADPAFSVDAFENQNSSAKIITFQVAKVGNERSFYRSKCRVESWPLVLRSWHFETWWRKI